MYASDSVTLILVVIISKISRHCIFCLFPFGFVMFSFGFQMKFEMSLNLDIMKLLTMKA